jgi:hypothetical protein
MNKWGRRRAASDFDNSLILIYVMHIKSRLGASAMRALVDIPDSLIAELATIGQTQRLPRAEIIRRAICAYVDEHKLNQSKDAFGLWAKESIDGLAYQEAVRSEW